MIEIRNLVKRYGDHLAVDHLNLTLEMGKVYGFLGPNGAGKSTTMNIMTGYLSATEGDVVVNGHSILDDEPKYGLAVTGFVHPDRVLTNSGARPGDVLLLTKPIGIGVLTTAQKAEMLSAEGRALAEELMTTLNKSARDAMVKYRVHACTDVTGFGLLGHSYEMAQGSDV